MGLLHLEEGENHVDTKGHAKYQEKLKIPISETKFC